MTAENIQQSGADAWRISKLQIFFPKYALKSSFLKAPINQLFTKITDFSYK
jgi:hypothetical protein